MDAKDYTLETVKAIVENPNDVKVERVVDSMGVLLRLGANKLDAGTIIGKQGATISAIRLIAKIIGHKNRERISIKFDNA